MISKKKCCENMVLVSIYTKNMMKNAQLLKISPLVQIGGEI